MYSIIRTLDFCILNFQSDSDDEEVDDLIQLTAECGIRTEWQFPRLKHCPVVNCCAKFGHRSQAIFHYRKFHSNAILCTICDKPISAKSLHNFSKHFKNVHPDEELPANVMEKMAEKKKQVSDTDGTDEIDDACGIDETDEVRNLISYSS